jgi:hypothetical protein
MLRGQMNEAENTVFIKNNKTYITRPYRDFNSEIIFPGTTYVVNFNPNHNEIIFINNETQEMNNVSPIIDINTIPGIKFISKCIEPDGSVNRFNRISSLIMINKFLLVVDSIQNCILLFNKKL